MIGMSVDEPNGILRHHFREVLSGVKDFRSITPQIVFVRTIPVKESVNSYLYSHSYVRTIHRTPGQSVFSKNDDQGAISPHVQWHTRDQRTVLQQFWLKTASHLDHCDARFLARQLAEDTAL